AAPEEVRVGPRLGERQPGLPTVAAQGGQWEVGRRAVQARSLARVAVALGPAVDARPDELEQFADRDDAVRAVLVGVAVRPAAQSLLEVIMEDRAAEGLRF